MGNLGQDPKVETTPNGKKKVTLSVATTDHWRAKTNPEAATQWHRVVCWGPTADFAETYLRKGRLVCVEGSIGYRRWQDKDGSGRWNNLTEISVAKLQDLGSRSKNTEGEELPSTTEPIQTEDNVPF